MGKREVVEKKYNLLKKEHTLPALKEVEKTLDTNLEELPVIKTILTTMIQEVQDVLNHLHGIIEPTHFVQIVESEFYKETEKKELAKTFREHIAFIHELVAGLYSEEKEQIRIFKESFEKMPEIREQARQLALEHAKKWKTKPKKERSHTHFG